MATDWLKIEVNTPDKPEVFAITAMMKWDDPDLTVGKLCRLWRWFDQHTQNGDAPGVTDLMLDRICNAPGFTQALASVGWITLRQNGATLPNFDRHNGKTAKQRALTARRMGVLRQQRHTSDAPSDAISDAGNVTSASASKVKKRSKEGEGGKDAQQTPKGTPHGLNELQYAARLIEEIRMPSTPQNIRQVAAGIKAEESTQGGLAQAFEFVRDKALAETERSGTVSGFWFQDAKWRTKVGKPAGNGILGVNGAELRRKAVERLKK